MPSPEAERREEILDGLLSMRRVRRLLPGNEDVARATAGLEAALGETVPQRTAARALGVTHPELAKLLGAKLKTADTPRGKAQVVVSSLLDLIEAREAEGEAPDVVLAPGSKRRRAREENAAAADGARDISQIMEMRALAYHRALARNLDRSMVDRASEIVSEWRADEKLTAEQADEWESVLAKPVDDVAAAMTDYSPRGKALREKSPFEAMGRRAEDRGSSDPE